MRCFTLIPDYTQSCVQEEGGEVVELSTLGLPQAILSEMEKWHNAYRKIIPLDQWERINRWAEIEDLDRQGIQLAESLERLVPGGAKVKYFSEGKFRLLK